MDVKLQNKLNWHWLHCLRNIRTRQELREFAGLEVDIREMARELGNVAHKLRPRGKRSKRCLPSAWEDIPLSLWRNSAFHRMWYDRHFGP